MIQKLNREGLAQPRGRNQNDDVSGVLPGGVSLGVVDVQ